MKKLRLQLSCVLTVLCERTIDATRGAFLALVAAADELLSLPFVSTPLRACSESDVVRCTAALVEHLSPREKRRVRWVIKFNAFKDTWRKSLQQRPT